MSEYITIATTRPETILAIPPWRCIRRMSAMRT
jgi:hypothetical protein